jgi:glutamyl-tRNA synthetase
LDTGRYPVGYVKAALDTCYGKIKRFCELPEYGGFYFREEFDYDPEGVARHFVPENAARVRRLREALAQVSSFDAATLEATLKSVAAELGVKPAVLVHPVRLACTGRTAGPSLYHLMEVLGRDRVLARLDRALARPEWAG